MHKRTSLLTTGLASVPGARQQLNQITSYIDASQVYGSDAELAQTLRDISSLGTGWH